MIERKLAINGRFLGRSITGVERFAREVTRAIDGLLAERHPSVKGLSVRLLVPPGTKGGDLFRHIPCVAVGLGDGHTWEQLSLPLATQGESLLSLCNTGPLLKRDHWVVIHDAAICAAPEGFGWKFRAWYQLLHRLLGYSARGVATVSEFSRSELQRWYGMRPQRVHTLAPEGCQHVLAVASDDKVLSRHGLTSRPYVLAVSSAQPNKNFRLIVEAAALLGDAGFDLVIAGGTNPHVFAAANMVLPPNMRHLGYVTDSELVALYSHAACFVFPSVYEGFGLPPAEAMALGCPVLSARCASMPEVCGDAALYFDPHDAVGLAALLRQTVSDLPLRQRLRAAGLARSERFDWRLTALSLLSLYQASEARRA